MGLRKGDRRFNTRTDDREGRQPRNIPYEGTDRNAGRSLCRAYRGVDFKQLRRQQEDAQADEQAEQRERQYRHGLLEDCRSLRIDVDGTETSTQLEALLDEHNRKLALLQRAGVSPASLLDDPQVNRQWERYSRAREMATLWLLPLTDHTPLVVIEEVNRNEYHDQVARLADFQRLQAAYIEQHSDRPMF